VLPDTKVDLPEKQAVASVSAITIPDRVSELDLIIPEYDLTALLTANQTAANAFISDTIQTFEEEEAPGRRLMARMQDITLRDFDAWYPDEESEITVGKFGYTQTPTTQTRPPRELPTPTSADVGRRQLDLPEEDAFKTGITFDEEPGFGGAGFGPDIGGGFGDEEPTTTGRISDIPSTPGTVERFKSALQDTSPPTRTAVPAPSRKRPRNLQVDKTIEIPAKRFKKMLEEPPLREQRFAPRTVQELMAQQNADVEALPTLNDLLKQPASGTDLPEPFMRSYRRNIEKLNVRAPVAPADLLRQEQVTPATERRRPAAEEEETGFGGAGFGPDFGGGFGREEYEFVPTETTTVTTTGIEQPFVTLPEVLPEDELQDIVIDAYRTPDERRRLSRAMNVSRHLDEPEVPLEQQEFMTDDERHRIIEQESERERLLRERSIRDQEELKRHVAEKGVTDRTLKVMNIFNETFKHQDQVNFNRMLEGKQRVTAARCFYELLVLKTRNFVDVQQDAPYENIIVTKPTA
jgi:hypothetical protein